MSKIDSLKNGTEPRRGARDWSSPRFSLVAADMTVSGGVAQYHYADGRVCSHPDGAFHDCGYVEARNRLIPTAQRMAHESLIGTTFSNEPAADMRYSRAFMGAMTRLWEGRNRS